MNQLPLTRTVRLRWPHELIVKINTYLSFHLYRHYSFNFTIVGYFIYKSRMFPYGQIQTEIERNVIKYLIIIGLDTSK